MTLSTGYDYIKPLETEIQQINDIIGKIFTDKHERTKKRYYIAPFFIKIDLKLY
jgi:hypothetical protein